MNKIFVSFHGRYTIDSEDHNKHINQIKVNKNNLNNSHTKHIQFDEKKNKEGNFMKSQKKKANTYMQVSQVR